MKTQERNLSKTTNLKLDHAEGTDELIELIQGNEQNTKTQIEKVIHNLCNIGTGVEHKTYSFLVT